MNELDLRDIHLPDASLWWPLAPGWWLLLALLMLAGLLLWWLLHRRRHPPLTRTCLDELDSIRRAHGAGQSDHATLGAITRLLRRTLISHGNRATEAAITGTAWIQRLQQLSPRHGFSEAQLHLLAYERYRANPDCDIDGLLQACESWIRNLPRGGHRVSA